MIFVHCCMVSLFIWYINDFIFSNFEGGTCLYADDTALYVTANSIDLVVSAMNRNLVKIENWTNSNRLTIYSTKTKYMVFDRSPLSKCHNVYLHIGSTKLEARTYYDYLGIQLDDTLSFELHIDKVVNSCNARLCT